MLRSPPQPRVADPEQGFMIITTNCGRASSPRTCGAIWRWCRSSSSRSISTTRSARASSRRSAGCRGIASRARSTGCSWRHAADIVADLGEADRSTIVELGCGSGEKLAVLAEALQRRRRLRARAPHRHLVAGARADRAAADAAAARLGRRPPVDLRSRPAARRGRACRRRPDARAAARLEHRQLRRAGRPRVPAPDPAACSSPATCSCSEPISSSRSASCSSPTTIRSA